MKIMYCITSSSWGGAQLHVLELCQDQINRGNEVTFVVGNKGPLLNKISKIAGVKVILLPQLVRKISPVNDIKAIINLRKIIKQENPDIVHLHSSKAGTLGRIASIGLNSKVIFTVHGWAFTEGINSKLKKIIYKYIEKSISRFTDLFICVSAYDKKLGIEKGVLNSKTSVEVIHNGSPEPDKGKVNFSVHFPIRLVMIARFSPQKNQVDLIKAVKDLPKDKYQLTFVGDGSTLKSCKKLTESLGLNQNIKFLGFKDDVTEELIANDVYLLITHYEGLPISIIEAMSYGLPVIASDVGGNSELVINDQNGYLVDNVKEITNSITKLISNPDIVRNMGKASYDLYKHELTIGKNMDSVNEAYEKLLS